MSEPIEVELPVGASVADVKPELVAVEDIVPPRKIDARQRDSAATERQRLRADDIVELEYEDGFVQQLTAADYRILQERRAVSAEGVRGGRELAATALRVVRVAGERVAELAGISQTELEERLKKLALDEAEELAAEAIRSVFRPLLQGLEDRRFERDAPSTGVGAPKDVAGKLYRVNRAGALVDGAPERSGRHLLLVHGTWTLTEQAFEGLLKSPQWASLFDAFHGSVFAYQYRTLSRDPAENALCLVEQLPDGSELTVLGHGSGGLIAELLCLEPSEIEEELLERHIPESDRDRMRALLKLLEKKNCTVERLLRVAAPVRGTLLVSRRLDTYLSLTMSGLRLAASSTGAAAPLLAGGVDFLKTVGRYVLKYSKDSRFVPGLAALRPDSALVLYLNDDPARETKSAGKLAVVAGDVRVGGSLQHSLKVLASDAFYRERHDFLVHTKGMFGGVPRVDRAVSLFESTAVTNHDSYFANESTRLPICAWLQDRPTNAFVTIGSERDPLAGERGLGQLLELHEEVKDPGKSVDSELDTVVLVPGVMGSHLAQSEEGERIWFEYGAALSGDVVELDLDTKLEAPSILKPFYGDLFEFLSKRYRVRVLPYDWRVRLDAHVDRLAELVDEELERTRDRAGRVHLLAHSMGGLVCRAYLAKHGGGAWARQRARGGRLVMAGTPNRGAYSMLRMLATGEHSVLEKLNFFVRARRRREGGVSDLREVLRELPGLLVMLPSDFDGGFERSWWASIGLPDQLLPAETDLRAARQAQESLADVPPGTVYIAGHARTTLTGVPSNGALSFEEGVDAGDGTVPYKGGIPDGADVWYVPAAHDEILAFSQAFEGIADILDRGETTRSTPSRDRPESSWWSGLFRGETPTATDSTDVRLLDEPGPAHVFPTEDDLRRALMAQRGPEELTERESLVLSVAHGGLHAASFPVLVGHYEGEAMGGSERDLDRRMSGRLSRYFEAGVYPGPLGTARTLYAANSDPPGAVVVGLGEVGALSSGALIDTACNAMTTHLLAQFDLKQKEVGLSCLLVGAIGALTVRESVRALVEAALRANDRLAEVGVRLSELEFVEQFEDVALDAIAEVQELPRSSTFADRPRTRLEPARHLRSLDGAQSHRRGSGFEATWPHRARVECGEDNLAFDLMTTRARTERDSVRTSWRIVDQLIKDATEGTGTGEIAGRNIGFVLFNSLVPTSWREAVAQDLPLQLSCDTAAARIPWELMVDAHGETEVRPPATRFPFTRQLIRSRYRARPRATQGRRALVLGDFEEDRYALPGAHVELGRVERLLERHGWDVESMVGPETRPGEVLAGLAPTPTLLHIAAHGLAGPPSGIVLPGDKERKSLLDGSRFEGLLEVPQVVFLNCCHSGALNQDEAMEGRDFAPDMAGALIASGVHAVVVAGWPVHDGAAAAFAEQFWSRLLDGSPLGVAAMEARLHAWKHFPGINTWGAYQVYGDPGYRMPGAHRPEQTEARSPRNAMDLIASWQMGVAHTTSPDVKRRLADRLRHLEEALPESWRRDATLAERLADAWRQANDLDRCLIWYDRAVRGDTASFRGVEQFLDSWTRSLRKKKKESVALFELSQHELHLDVDDSKRTTIAGPARAREMVEALVRIQPNHERLSLLASAWKDHGDRLAEAGENGADWRGALEKARDLYEEAAASARSTGDEAKIYYPLFTSTALAVILESPNEERSEKWLANLGEVRRTAALGVQDYWSKVAPLDATLLETLLRQDLGDARRDDLLNLYARVKRQWSPRADYWSSTTSFIGLLEGFFERIGNADAERRDALQAWRAFLIALHEDLTTLP